jgi:hypothetical protein
MAEERTKIVEDRDRTPPWWLNGVVAPLLVAILSGAALRELSESSLPIVLVVAAVVGGAAALLARAVRASVSTGARVHDQAERIALLESEVARLTRLTHPGWLQPLITESLGQGFTVVCEPEEVIFTAPDGRSVVAHCAGMEHDFARSLEYRQVLDGLESLGFENPWKVPARRMVTAQP